MCHLVRVSGLCGFFLFSLRAKVRVPFAWFLQIPPTLEAAPIQSETSAERPAPRAVLPGGPSYCGVEICCPTWEGGLQVRSSVTLVLCDHLGQQGWKCFDEGAVLKQNR